MKKINLAIIGIKPLPNGGIVVLTRPSKDNTSPNGSHVFNAVQAQRLATRVLGFTSPFGIALLMQAVATADGAAVLSIECITHKAGTPWENTVTGEKGTYGDKNGGKDWVEQRNQEISLGVAATLNLMNSMVSSAMASAINPVESAAPAPKKAIAAITNETEGTQDNGAAASNTQDDEA